jgi:HEAT repeat protein
VSEHRVRYRHAGVRVRRLDSRAVRRPSAKKTSHVGKAEPDATDYAAWVAQLSDPLRASPAYWHLVVSGPEAREAVVHGLGSDDASTRRHCARALDHLVDESSFPALIDLLDDTDPFVRVEAIHALACDRCKDDACRPVASAVLPKAVDVLTNDSDPHVRAYAVELVGRFVHTHLSAEQAIVAAAETDASPAVRKKARWYAPGGS